MTSRQIKDRLDRELIGNLSIKVEALQQMKVLTVATCRYRL